MRPEVDRTLCLGHGRCLAICPDVFDLDDDGIAIVLSDSLGPERESDLQAAALGCPEGAITIVKPA